MAPYSRTSQQQAPFTEPTTTQIQTLITLLQSNLYLQPRPKLPQEEDEMTSQEPPTNPHLSPATAQAQAAELAHLLQTLQTAHGHHIQNLKTSKTPEERRQSRQLEQAICLSAGEDLVFEANKEVWRARMRLLEWDEELAVWEEKIADRMV